MPASKRRWMRSSARAIPPNQNVLRELQYPDGRFGAKPVVTTTGSIGPPKVSVCVDVHNYAEFLPQAIESVLGQDFTDFELIIADDASTDQSFEIARHYASQDERIKARRNHVNLGMVKNRNVALRQAGGTYVKILHADDFFHRKDALDQMVNRLDEHPGMSLVAGPMVLLPAPTAPSKMPALWQSEAPVIGTSVITRCLKEKKNLIGSPSATMFRRDRAQRGLDETFFHAADWEMWLHLLEQGCFGWIAEPLATYRLHPNQQTEKDKQTLSQYEDTQALYDRYLDRPYVELSKVRQASLRHSVRSDLIKHSLRHSEHYPTPTEVFPVMAPLYLMARQFFGLQNRIQRKRRHHQRSRPAPESLAAFPPGLNVAGFFKGEYGIGDSSRAYRQILNDSSFPTAFLNIHSRDHRNQDRSFDPSSKTLPYGINLMTFSFDYARRFSRDQGDSFFRFRYNIGLWFWELEKFPASWHPAFSYYDEIWTATSFCQKSLIEVSPLPVTQIGYPFPLETAPEPNPHGFGLDPDDYHFLFNFDFHSVLHRKNPAGLIAAFQNAFEGRKTKTRLILKSINAHHHPEAAAQLRESITDSRILWFDQHLDGHKMKQLFATADCYISLHRSEGLGLGMARSMAYGKPVIATGYSGNMDFTTPENSLLVRYELTELKQSYGVYEKGNFWAEPDLNHAIELMRWVQENPQAAKRLGERAQSEVRASLNPTRAMTKLSQRLSEIDPRLRSY